MRHVELFEGQRLNGYLLGRSIDSKSGDYVLKSAQVLYRALSVFTGKASSKTKTG